CIASPVRKVVPHHRVAERDTLSQRLRGREDQAATDRASSRRDYAAIRYNSGDDTLDTRRDHHETTRGRGRNDLQGSPAAGSALLPESLSRRDELARLSDDLPRGEPSSGRGCG